MSFTVTIIPNVNKNYNTEVSWKFYESSLILYTKDSVFPNLDLTSNGKAVYKFSDKFYIYTIVQNTKADNLILVKGTPISAKTTDQMISLIKSNELFTDCVFYNIPSKYKKHKVGRKIKTKLNYRNKRNFNTEYTTF